MHTTWELGEASAKRLFPGADRSSERILLITLHERSACLLGPCFSLVTSGCERDAPRGSISSLNSSDPLWAVGVPPLGWQTGRSRELAPGAGDPRGQGSQPGSSPWVALPSDVFHCHPTLAFFVGSLEAHFSFQRLSGNKTAVGAEPAAGPPRCPELGERKRPRTPPEGAHAHLGAVAGTTHSENAL